MGCGASRSRRPSNGLEADRSADVVLADEALPMRSEPQPAHRLPLAPISPQRQPSPPTGKKPELIAETESEGTESEASRSPGEPAVQAAAHAAPEERPLPVITSASSIPAGEFCDAGGCGCGGEADELDAAAWLAALPEDVRESEEEWHRKLSEEQFRVLRMKGTEEIHTGAYNEHFESGTYACAGCALPLYSSGHKFRSGHGWPAFGDNLEGALERHGSRKVEITCAGCGGHVGHVFKSSRYPKPKNERHCVNSVSLRFLEAGVEAEVA